jgi:hypothetical protein
MQIETMSNASSIRKAFGESEIVDLESDSQQQTILGLRSELHQQKHTISTMWKVGVLMGCAMVAQLLLTCVSVSRPSPVVQSLPTGDSVFQPNPNAQDSDYLIHKGMPDLQPARRLAKHVDLDVDGITMDKFNLTGCWKMWIVNGLWGYNSESYLLSLQPGANLSDPALWGYFQHNDTTNRNALHLERFVNPNPPPPFQKNKSLERPCTLLSANAFPVSENGDPCLIDPSQCIVPYTRTKPIVMMTCYTNDVIGDGAYYFYLHAPNEGEPEWKYRMSSYYTGKDIMGHLGATFAYEKIDNSTDPSACWKPPPIPRDLQPGLPAQRSFNVTSREKYFF